MDGRLFVSLHLAGGADDHVAVMMRQTSAASIVISASAAEIDVIASSYYNSGHQLKRSRSNHDSV